MNILRHLIIEPIQYRSAALGWYRFWQVLDDRTNGAFDGSYRQFLRFWRPPIALSPSPKLEYDAIASVARTLQRDGYAELPYQLSASDLGEMRRFMFSTPAFGLDPDKPVVIRADSIPSQEGRYTWRTGDVIAQPVVQKVVLEGPCCAIAQVYLGCCPTLVTITMWLNPPFPPRQYDANNYHYDNDGPGFLKFFFLLTDMDLGSGAHYFVKGSHTPRKPVRVARSQRYEDETIFSVYNRNQEHIAGGPAGTIFAEDTRGFHRGSDLTERYRALLQLQFSIIDGPQLDEVRQKFSPVAVSGLDPGTAQITRKFFVRKS